MSKTKWMFVVVTLIILMAVIALWAQLPGQAFYGAFIQMPMIASGTSAGQCPTNGAGGVLMICGDSATGLMKTQFAGGTINTTGLYGVICAPLQSTTAVPDTTSNFTSGGTLTCKMPAGTAAVNKVYHLHAEGVYTNAAASLLEGRWAICTASGACGGTVVGVCDVPSTNQANNLTNGQWTDDCELTIAATGATGNAIAKSRFEANLGAATTAVLSRFQDTSTAVSSNFDTTQDEFLVFQWKFQTANAGNAFTVQAERVEQTAF